MLMKIKEDEECSEAKPTMCMKTSGL
jgi:hypothetical protein